VRRASAEGMQGAPVKLRCWSPGLLPALVRFWNRAFASKRNFFPLTEELFRSRVTRRRGGLEPFDPKDVVVAVEDGEVVGVVHAGAHPESVCRALDPEWPGGTQGYIAFLYVEPSRRRRGIGDALWHRAIERLKPTRQVSIDGQCLNPFYGNSEGPFTPFWGTPEGVSVEWDDSATKKWLARKGFAPRFRGVQLALSLGEGPSLGDARRAIARQDLRMLALQGEIPELGRRAGERRPVLQGLDFECIQVTRSGRTVGVLVAYPLKEVRDGLWAVYEAAVVESYRGRALGRRMLEAALARIRERGGRDCEVLTLPELSPGAFKLYTAAGFARACTWAIY
jgi:ribosomal protein S18 acetylase RimI-like enzyme